jgi:hypothetical protein
MITNTIKNVTIQLKIIALVWKYIALELHSFFPALIICVPKTKSPNLLLGFIRQYIISIGHIKVNMLRAIYFHILFVLSIEDNLCPTMRFPKLFPLIKSLHNPIVRYKNI